MTTHHHRPIGLLQPRLRCLGGTLIATVLILCILMIYGCAPFGRKASSEIEVGFIDIGNDLKLRRMVVRSSKPRAVVLFLHGFPETMSVWKDIASTLSDEFEVHAFDWPGYGRSSRPPAGQFSYSPKDYSHVLRDYIIKSNIDSANLIIYATDIGALPALLLAAEDPRVAKAIIVGDFAPFDRPQYMYPSLQSLKSTLTSEATHSFMNKNRDEILANAFSRGLAQDKRYEVSQSLKDDMADSWVLNGITAADAFYHYYAHFTRDQNYLEANLKRLTTPMQVVWGEKDIYIKPEMGVEFAGKTNSLLHVLPGLGHYPHLQRPAQTISEIRAIAKRL